MLVKLGRSEKAASRPSVFIYGALRNVTHAATNGVFPCPDSSVSERVRVLQSCASRSIHILINTHQMRTMLL